MSGFKNISAKEFEEGIKQHPDAVILDVRTEPEHMDEHIPGSVLINIMSPEFAQKIRELDKDKPYYVYCRSGNRSGSACGFMASQGFKELYNLAPGIMGWHGEVASQYK